MIELQDAIERAKLAADEDGILSAYTYDQIVHELNDGDKHAFTMALVDLGINTRRGSVESLAAIAKVLYNDDEGLAEGPEEGSGEGRQAQVLDDFHKAAQGLIKD